MAYLAAGAARLRVKVLGDLWLGGQMGGLPGSKPGGEAVPGLHVVQPVTAQLAAGLAAGPGADGALPAAAAAAATASAPPSEAAPSSSPSGCPASVAVAGQPASSSTGTTQKPGVSRAGPPAGWPDTTDPWVLQPADVDAIAVGAGILGTGGGGSPHNARLRLQRSMAAGQRAVVVQAAALRAGDWVVDVGGMGAPTVGAEKLDADEVWSAWRGRGGLRQG